MLITDSKILEKSCDEAIKEKIIAFDTEFMRDKTYYPKLSLIQIATSKMTFAVDMTCGLNYQPLAKLLEKPTLLKVIHSSRQDVELLYSFFGFIPKNLFDTQVAAIFLGYKESPSFEVLTFDFLGKKINKKLQFSDWLARPLSDEQLEYALSDASLLYEIFFKIEAQLAKKQRFEWVMAESNQILSGNIFQVTPEDILLKFISQLSKEEDLAICYRLVKWREQEAKARDIPRNHLLKDDTIIDLCHKKPNNLERFDKPRYFSKHIDTEEKAELLTLLIATPNSTEETKVVNKALSMKKLTTFGKNNLFYMLKALLEVISNQTQIRESFIATTSDLLALANGKIDAQTRVLNGWRKEVFGNTALGLLEGRVSLGYKDGDFFIS